MYYCIAQDNSFQSMLIIIQNSCGGDEKQSHLRIGDFFKKGLVTGRVIRNDLIFRVNKTTPNQLEVGHDL